MVAVFLRLRFTQLVNALRRPPVHLLGLAVLIGYAIAAVVFSIDMIDGLRDHGALGNVIIVGGSIVTIGYVAIPLFFGADDPADPRATLCAAVPPLRVASGLAVSAIISVPALLLVALAVGQVFAWSEHSDATLVAVLAGLIIIATGVLGARLTRTIAAFWLHRRRARETVGLVVIAGLLVSTPGLISIAGTDWATPEAQDRLAGFARTLGETPAGAAWAAPMWAAAGEPQTAWLSLLYGALVVVVMWFVWLLLVKRMLVSPPRPESIIRVTGLGWFDWMPATPAGAVAARSLSYWVRDGRYRLSLLAVPIVPLLLLPPLMVADVWWQNLALIPLPVMCLFLGWMIHNDTSADNTAIWLHVAAEVSGFADRIGRTVPPLLLGIPLIAIGAPLTAQLYGVEEILPSAIGVSVCLLLVGLGISSAVSARHPYPTVRPGDSPFAQPQSTTPAPGQALSFLGTIFVSLPVLGLAGLSLAEGGQWYLYTLGAGVLLGVGVYFLGVAVGARTFRRFGPELLAFSLRN